MLELTGIPTSVINNHMGKVFYNIVGNAGVNKTVDNRDAFHHTESNRQVIVKILQETLHASFDS